MFIITSHRREFTKRQRIVHSYGVEEEIDEEEVLQMVTDTLAEGVTETRAEANVHRTTQKTCACGGTDHVRRSSSKCPLNKRRRK